MALDALSRDPEVEVVGLLTSVTRTYDRISVHGVRRTMLEAQVKRLGLPLFEISLDPGCTNDAYEAAFHTALASLYDEKEIESFFYIILEQFHNKKRIDLALHPEME